MRKLLLLLLAAAGCGGTIEPLVVNNSNQTFGPYWARAYFQRNTSFGTQVLVCDVRPKDVACYAAPSGNSFQ